MKRKNNTNNKTSTETLSKLNPHYEQILILTYKFRFLNISHFQKILNHKYPERIRTWLSYLTSEKYLKREFSKKFAGEYAIFSLGTKGRKYFIKHPEIEDINISILNKVWRKYCKRFKKHCMFLAEIYISLVELIKRIKKGKLYFFTKTDLTGVAYLLRKEPDAYFTIKHKNTERYFLDIFDDYRFVILEMHQRIRRYIRYFKKEDRQNNMKLPFPEVILICPDNTTKNSANKFIRRKLSENSLEMSFYLSTWNEIKKQGLNRQVLHKVELE